MVPLKNLCVDGLIDINGLESQSPHIDMQWKFGEHGPTSIVVNIIWQEFVVNTPRVSVEDYVYESKIKSNLATVTHVKK
ncbi:hypothetical protein TNCV_3480181 [Trichonephila clavipes]|nr:hypothetical protein TNCV_3480181 [Trichonephila clavipes]